MTAQPPAFKNTPSRLYVETTTRCNLQCGMCVKQTDGWCAADKDMSLETFERLVPSFEGLEVLTLNGIGEPLLNKRILDFIRLARKHMPKDGIIGFQTNGKLVNEERATALLEAGLDRICLSVDAACPENFKIIRPGGELSDIERSFAALAQAKNATGRDDFRIGAETVVMRNTVADLPKVIEWCASQGADFMIASHILPYDKKAASLTAYEPSTDTARALYAKHKAASANKGIMLDRYMDVLWRGNRSREDQDVLDAGVAMQEEARLNDIWIRPKRLVKGEDPIVKDVQTAFTKAQEIADAHNIELTLPSITPTTNRRCEFVENGTAFIGVEGSVHPCHFLWHKHSCHIDERDKPVEPVSFGSLNGKGAATAWNSPEYSDFRKTVTAYDWPFCWDCSMAPCEYLDGRDFGNDCYATEVPCADCPWALGLLHCLS